MSDASSVVSSLLSVDELLSPQFLYPVCGVILCAVAVFLVGVGFKSSSEPKFQISGEGDGVPFLKKKKKKTSVEKSVPVKKSPSSVVSSAKTLKGRRTEEVERVGLSSVQTLVDRNTTELTSNAAADEWITPVSRKEKKARRKFEIPSDVDTCERVDLVEAAPVSIEKAKEESNVNETKVTTLPAPQRPTSEKKNHASPKKDKEELPKESLTKQEPEKAIKKEEDTNAKKVNKPKQKQTTEPVSKSPPVVDTAKSAPVVAEEPKVTTITPAATSTLNKKKKKATAGTGAVAESAGAFQLAEFELPTAVTTSARHASPSPPSTDSSFELVDGDAVREEFEEAEEKTVRSRTSGASKKKSKKLPAAKTMSGSGKETIIEKISEEIVSASAASTSKEPSQHDLTPVTVSEEPGDEWQDAKSTRKRRRARRDD